MGRLYSNVVVGIAIVLSGCLLDTEICGPDFVEADGRCVPAEAPPPFRTARADGALADDAAVGDAARGEPDAERVLDAAGPSHPWAAYNFIVVVDRTRDNVVRRTPRTPGVDVDAIAHGPAGAELWASEVADWFLIERANIADDPQQVVGPPRDRNDPTLALSLGGEGGYVAVPNELGRPFSWGDQISVHLQNFDGAEDSMELFVCLEVPISSRGCLSLGAGPAGADIVTIRAERP